MKQILPLLILFFSCICTDLHAQNSTDQSNLTLAGAYEITLANNYSISIARDSKKIAQNNLSYGNAGFLPTLDLIGSQNFEIQDSELTFVNDEEQIVTGARSKNFNASAQLSWTIFDGARMFIEYDRLEQMKEAGTLDAKVTIENTLAQVANAYYGVVLEKENLRLLRDNLELSRERLTIAQTKYEVGKASKMEYLSAKVDYNEDTAAFVQQKEALFNAKANLNTLLAREADAGFTVPDTITLDPQLQFETLNNNLLDQNPDLLLAQKNQHIAHLEMESLKAEQYPEINLNASYNYGTASAQSGFVLNRQSNGLAYGISATFNIFNGFNKQRNIENITININQQQKRIKEIRQELTASLSKTYMNYINNRELVDLESENLSVARENAEVALERYRLGSSNALELREAQNNALDAAIRLLEARYNTKIAYIELKRLSGTILDEE